MSSSDSSSDESDRRPQQEKQPKNQEILDEDVPVISHKEQRKAKKREAAGLAALGKKKTKLTDTAAPVQAAAAVKTSQYGVWIGNLNFTTNQNSLRDWLATQLLSAKGDIVRVNLPTGQNGRSKGFAYVDFSTEEAQQAAIAASEGHLDGRKLLIKSSTDYSGRPSGKGDNAVAGDIAAILHETRPDQPTPKQPSTSKAVTGNMAEGAAQTLSKKMKKIAAQQKNPPGPTLFMGNLGFETKEEDIRSLFDAHHRASLKWQPGAKKSFKKRVAGSTKEKKEKKKAKKETEGGDEEDGSSSSGSSDSDSDSDSDDESDSSESEEDLQSAADAQLPDAGIRKVRMGTFQDTGKCKGWAFIDFFDVKKATISLLNPHNHFLNGRTLKVEYASAEAVRRGGNKQQKMLRDPPGDKKTGKKLPPQKRAFHQVDQQPELAAPQTPIEDIKLLTKEELEGPAPKKHKPTQEERKAAREAKKQGGSGGGSKALGGRPKAPATASTTPSGAKVTFDE